MNRRLNIKEIRQTKGKTERERERERETGLDAGLSGAK
jgi:hypothetical protein